MNNEKYARLTIVVDRRTDRALRYVSAVTDTGLSEIVRELISEPAITMADAMSSVVNAETPSEVRAAEDQIDMFVEGAYGEYLAARGNNHG